MCWRSSSANSRKTCLPSESSKRSPVLLEEPVRPALAADADPERLLVVDALAQPLGALGEEAVGRPFEEEERRL